MIRIVELTIQKGKEEEFVALFSGVKFKIRGFEGCHELSLLQDKSQPHVFKTYSIWENEESLERYRHSELFKSTWSKVKPLFAEKAKAWSYDRLFISDSSM